MAKNNTLAQQKQEKIIDITEQLSTEETIDAIEGTIALFKEEYGNYMVTKEMREELQKELGVDEETANGWEKMSDILNHIDVYELAKRHPETVGQIARGIASVIGNFFSPIAGKVAERIPDELAAKIVGFAGLLAPEHILNVVAKDQLNRARERRKKELLELEEQFKTASDEELLIVVCEDDLLNHEIGKLVKTKDDTEDSIVGTEDGSVKIVSWTKKTWKNNFRDPRLKNVKILFIGTADETVRPIAEKDTRFEKFGISYGWVENQAFINADTKALEYKEYYKQFIQELKSLPLPETAKNSEKTQSKTKTWTTIAATLLLGPIGTAGSLIGMHAKDKKTLLQQMLLYGILNLYNNDLETFMNS